VTAPVPNAVPQLLGNAVVRQRLRSLVREQRLHHCLIFEGPEGIGKATTARWLAMFHNCAAVLTPPGPSMFGPPPVVDEPCGTCSSCRSILRGEHPDVITLGLQQDRAAPIISVAQVRELVSALTLRPFLAVRRYVVIDPADGLRSEGANALLKTLEEPPTDTGFILVTSSPMALLATVRSRSMRVRFAPVPRDQLEGWLAGRGLPDPARLAQRADGSPGTALRLAEVDTDQQNALRQQVLAAIAAGVGDLFNASEALADGERSVWAARVEDVLTVLSQLLVDALLASCGSPLRYHPDRPDIAAAWAQALGPRGITRLATRVDDARGDLVRFLNGRLLLDTLLAAFATELGAARRVGATP
jgi:DNA polymerase III subunit delta'